MTIRLFIENTEVELDNKVEFAITKQFEDVSNPTTIINDWSKTVSIPFTDKNNALFGHIYKPDRITAYASGATGIGVYFDPRKKLSFRLMSDDNILMQGYAKVNEIKQNKGRGSYEVTLFGELGRVFSEMKKITFDRTTEDTDYLIDCSTYFEDYMTKENVKDSWESEGQSSPLLIGDYTNYMGFAPNNSFDSVFDYKSFQKDSLNSDTFENALEGVSFVDATGVEPATAIPDGLLPRELGEYRSYLQLPFVYFNKLFKIFQAKAESVTGYTFDLDSNWFSASNPYWFKLIYILKKLDAANGDSYNNSYEGIYTNNSTNTILARWNEPATDAYTTPQTGNLYISTVVEEQKPVLNGHDKLYLYSPMVLNLRLRTRLVVSSNTSIKTNNGLLLTVKVTGENNATKSQSFLIVNENWSGSYSDATIVRTGTSSGINLSVPYLDYYFSLDENTFGDYVTLSFSTEWLVNSYPFTGDEFTTFYYIDSSVCTGEVKINGAHWARSGAKFTLNDFWNNEYNLFSEILNYCKIFRIGVFVDDKSKTISFIPFSKFFSDYSIEDWTEKVDFSKDFIIKPIAFDSKYVCFNYDDNTTKLGKQYKEQYGQNYGDIKKVTNYNFDDNTTNLFSGVKAPIVNTDNILSWTSLYSNKKIVYTFPAEKHIYCQDDDKKYVECFGQYYFHNGTIAYDDDPQLRDVVISDDTPFQQYNDKYFYSQTVNSTAVLTHPNIALVNGSNLCMFNTPKENYTYNSSEYDNKKSIYDNFWDAYINERYNENNKIVTCHIEFTPTMYANFAFNKFVKIDNQLYMVNKIYDYDITSSKTTKVDLITVQNLSGYMNVINW